MWVTQLASVALARSSAGSTTMLRPCELLAWLACGIARASPIQNHVDNFASTEIHVASNATELPAPPPPAPRGRSGGVAVLGLAIDLATVAIWGGLDRWCADADESLHVRFLYGHGDPNAALAKLPACANVHLQAQPNDLPDNRYERLANLRDALRDEINGIRRLARHLSAVMVLDLDLEQLPNWLPAMRDAVVTVQKSGGGARQILCANGYEHFLGLPQYYDLMALVHEDGSWEYTRLGGWYLLTLGQHRLYNAVSEAVGGYYGARSCFGGIAVYNASVYLNEHCAYREGAGRRFSDSSGTSESLFEALRRYTVNGERCEHVTLHECLHEHAGASGSALRVAVQSNMPALRTFDDRVARKLLSLLFVLASCGCLLLARRRRRRQAALATYTPATAAEVSPRSRASYEHAADDTDDHAHDLASRAASPLMPYASPGR